MSDVDPAPTPQGPTPPPTPSGPRRWVAVAVMFLVVVALAALATWAKGRG